MFNRWVDLKPFKAWCIQILPSIFDESMSYYEVLCKVIKILNNSLEDINILKEEVENTNSGLDEFKEGVTSQIDEFKEGVTSQFDEFKEGVKSQIGEFKEGVTSQFDEFKEGVKSQIGEFKEGVESQFDEFKEGVKSQFDEFKEGVETQFEELVNGTWIQGTIPYLEELLKQYIPVAIFFEINNDGYFVANIPETWDEIQFNTTGYDYPEINGVGYGHLVMSY